MVSLVPLAAEHAAWLGEFLVSDGWPFRAGTGGQDLVTERLRQSYYDGPGIATFIVTDGARRVGFVRVEDLNDPTPTFDLRIAAAHRGRGHGVAALRELARWVFDTHDVERLEGVTRQDNVAMRRTFRAEGFVKEAHYRRGWPTRDDRLLDAVGYTLLRTDWREGTTTPVAFNDEHDPIDSPHRGVAQQRPAVVSASARKFGGKTDAVDIRIERELGQDELIALYASVGWEAYTRSPSALVKAIDNSSIVVTARDERGELIGLARGLSDDASVFSLQDILVRPDHQRTGVGRQLLTLCLERYGHVRQKVLVTDDDEAQQRFYESLGYVNTTNVTAASLNAYVRFDSPPTP